MGGMREIWGNLGNIWGVMRGTSGAYSGVSGGNVGAICGTWGMRGEMWGKYGGKVGSTCRIFGNVWGGMWEQFGGYFGDMWRLYGFCGLPRVANIWIRPLLFLVVLFIPLYRYTVVQNRARFYCKLRLNPPGRKWPYSTPMIKDAVLGSAPRYFIFLRIAISRRMFPNVIRLEKDTNYKFRPLQAYVPMSSSRVTACFLRY